VSETVELQDFFDFHVWKVGRKWHWRASRMTYSTDELIKSYGISPGTAFSVSIPFPPYPMDPQTQGTAWRKSTAEARGRAAIERLQAQHETDLAIAKITEIVKRVTPKIEALRDRLQNEGWDSEGRYIDPREW
jgi:hypothetical protein